MRMKIKYCRVYVQVSPRQLNCLLCSLEFLDEKHHKEHLKARDHLYAVQVGFDAVQVGFYTVRVDFYAVWVGF